MTTTMYILASPTWILFVHSTLSRFIFYSNKHLSYSYSHFKLSWLQSTLILVAHSTTSPSLHTSKFIAFYCACPHYSDSSLHLILNWHLNENVWIIQIWNFWITLLPIQSNVSIIILPLWRLWSPYPILSAAKNLNYSRLAASWSSACFNDTILSRFLRALCAFGHNTIVTSSDSQEAWVVFSSYVCNIVALITILW